MNPGPRIDSYQWRGGREAMLRFGPADGPVVVAALPLLEEANRTRAFVVTILRLLAEVGIGGVLPDLPGQGESLVPTREMRMSDLREAFGAAARASGAGVFGVAVRSGALLDHDADLSGRWCLSPQSAEELLREWRRIASGGLEGELVEVAGSSLSRSFLNELGPIAILPGAGRGPASAHSEAGSFSPTPVQLDPGLRRGGWERAGEREHTGGEQRTVRLDADPRPADLHISGSPPWRRAEPGNDPALAQQLATDIAQWIRSCGG